VDGLVIRQEISRGIDPVVASTDVARKAYIFYVYGKRYDFPLDKCPFTLTDRHCADKALVLKYGS
jgi:hypothetical protein